MAPRAAGRAHRLLHDRRSGTHPRGRLRWLPVEAHHPRGLRRRGRPVSHARMSPHRARSAPEPAKTRRVLIVDDNAINRRLLSTLLGSQGHEIFEAVDGREGLEVAERTQPHLVIADVLMPVMDGYELVQRLRATSGLQHIPVIFYTAHYHEREAQRLAASCRVARVLIKPCEPFEI